jgi:hypothetical protein
MATILNAGTTTATGLNITADVSGAMDIQTSGLTAIAINSSQAVTLTNPLPAGSGGTGLNALGTGVATFLGTPSSANLLAAVTGETGTGALVFGTSPTLSTPTISDANLTGTPVAPTATAGTNTTQIATTAFVTAIIPAGSVMLFYQASAPSGWTQVTTQNNKALRVVSGTGGVAGGTTAFSTVFANQTVTTSVSVSGTTGATTLSIAQMPSHSHSTNIQGRVFCGSGDSTFSDGNGSNISTSGEGGGGSHTHSFSGSGSGTSSAVTLNVQYIDIILCSKN